MKLTTIPFVFFLARSASVASGEGGKLRGQKLSSLDDTVNRILAKGGGGNKKVAICHGTSSDKNPYVVIDVDESALATHLSDAHNSGKTYHDYLPDQNVVLKGQKFYLNNKCDLEPTDDDVPPPPPPPPPPAPTDPPTAPPTKAPTTNAPAPTDPPTAPPTKAPTTNPPAPTDPPTDPPTKAPTTNPPAPTDPPIPTKAPTYITGDPHIKTFNGDSFDFHGGCDLVLLHNPSFNDGQGLEIHIRTKITRWWSSIESAVVRIGDDILEIKAGIEDRTHWINGKKAKFKTSRNFPFTIGGFRGRFRHRSELIVQYKIFLPNDQILLIRSVKDMLRVELDGTNQADFGKAMGLIGSYNGRFLGRDGLTEYEDVNEFGKAWQVNDSDPQLFQTMEGPQFPEQCTMPEMEGPSIGRRVVAGSITPSMAKKACAHVSRDDFKNCVSDVLTMDDVIAAEEY